MTRLHVTTPLIVLGLVLGAGIAKSQVPAESETLPEIARRLRAERGRRPDAAGPVFTNENIGNVRGVINSSIGAVPPPAVIAAGDAPADEMGEAEWRARFDEAGAEIQRAEDRVSLTRQELQTLNNRLLTESGTFNREGQLLPLITEKEAEIGAAEQRVVAANEALAALREALRRAGAPAGWGR